MNFTFGIITGGGNDGFINDIIDSIEVESIPNYEVIVVGPTLVNRKNTTIIEFDETIKRAWITRKKNIITIPEPPAAPTAGPAACPPPAPPPVLAVPAVPFIFPGLLPPAPPPPVPPVPPGPSPSVTPTPSISP